MSGEVHAVRGELAAHLRQHLPLDDDRIVERARAVDVGGRSLVQLALDSVAVGTGDEALHRTASITVWVVEPGDGTDVDDRLDALLDLVLRAVDRLDDTVWTEARRATYPPGNPTHPAYIVTVTREV